MRMRLAAWILVSLLCPPTAGADVNSDEPGSLLLATTTSVRDSGLLDVLLPPFQQATGIRVRTIAVGTGAALRMGSEGNADVLLTHAPEAERSLLATGAISRRVAVMQNHFVLVGPREAPASIREASSVLAAIRDIRDKKLPFVSRGDDSGTHKREVELFLRAGVDPEQRWPNFTRTGSGMGLSLEVAGQRRAYILSDIGTFLAFRKHTHLEPMTPPEDLLRNIYSVLLVSPTRFPRVHSREARKFADFLQGETARSLMARFGLEEYGRVLFEPLPSAITHD